MSSATDHASLQKSASRLNHLIQVISRSSSAIDQICGENPEARRHLNALSTGLAGASLVVNDLIKQIEILSTVPAPSAAPSDSSPTAQAIPSIATPKAVAPKFAPPPAASDAATEPPDTTTVIENPSGNKELVLIIDDEETIVTYVKDTLIRDGYRVIGCISPFDAIKAYKRFKDSIALVILDYTLPIMNGQEVFDEMRSLNPRVAVMLSSGFAEQKDVNSMLARGLRGFLPKPYTEDRLLAQVRSTIAASRGGTSVAPTTPAAVPVATPAVESEAA